MAHELAARCGIYCGECDYKEKFDCPGCIKSGGKMFWGTCEVANCSIEKELSHCGECSSFVCDRLHGFAYDEGQGDNGKRIENIKEWNREGIENWMKKK